MRLHRQVVVGRCKFEASPIYRASSRIARDTVKTCWYKNKTKQKSMVAKYGVISDKIINRKGILGTEKI